MPIDPEKRPKAEAGDHEIDLAGHYVLPGFVDMHGHLGGTRAGHAGRVRLQALDGRTASPPSRDPGSGNGLDWMVEHKKKSERNEITAPRIEPT